MGVQLLAGFVSALTFAHLFHVPKDQIVRSGVVGGLGWAMFLLTKGDWGEIGGMFVAGTAVAVLSELLARKWKQPVVIFLIPGVIPLVPGGKAYLTMLSFLQNDYLEGLELLVSTVFLAGAVAAGIILASSVFRVYSRARHVKGEVR
jgi:uncharacterized membrane protein YjjB (DUF3815 family)